MLRRSCHAYLFASLGLVVPILTGCQSGVTDFANRLIGTDGQLFSVQDLEAIAADSTMSDEEKRQAFRDLGIADEELIDALLTL